MNKPHSWYFLGARLSLLLTVAILVSFAMSSIWYEISGAQGPPEAIVVDSLEDVKQNDGDCTLREAIIAANSDKKSGTRPGECPAGNSGFDTITLRAEPDPITGLAAYTLSRTDNGKEDAASTGDLDIFSDLNIMGAGTGETVIDASGISDRAFQIISGNVNITGVTITRNGTTVSGDGGAIYNDGNLTLTNSSVVDNGVTGLGGGIYNNTGLLTLNNSTISDNTAGDSGGGIANASAGSLALNNSTVSGNDAPDGGGIYSAGILELHNVTITANSSGVTNSDASGTVIVRNTIIADNDNDADVSGSSFTSQGYNLIGATAGDTGFEQGVNGDQVGIDPMLDSVLKDNGGQTLTHALLPESPAIDAGDPNGCFGSVGFLSMDQRGDPRPMDGDFDRQFRCDIGAFEVGGTGLVITRAKADGTIDGRLSSVPDTTFTLEFFSAQVCPTEFGPVDGATYLFPAPDPSQTILVKTDAFGNVYFSAVVTPPGDGTFVYGRATSLGGTAPEYSKCVPVGPGNTSWPNALSLDEKTSYPPEGTIDQYIDKQGQSRWYKLSVQPNSGVIVTLTGVDKFGNPGPLPANYDLTIYKDIAATFYDLIAPQENSDLVRLNAEFAGDAFSGDAFSGDAFSGDAFSGDAFSGDAFSGDAFSGDAFSGDAFSGDAFSGDAFSGDAFSADVYTGDAFSGDAFSGDAFSGDAFSGDAFSGDAFSSDAYNAVFSNAQTRSILGVSAFEGTASEGVRVNTWSNTGEFYVRVRGRNGAFSLDAPFRLSVTFEAGTCGSVAPLPNIPPLTPAGSPTTLILVDESRLDRIQGSGEIDLLAQLNSLAGHPAVNGLVVDVSGDQRVAFANGQADANPTCPYAKNLVVEAIQDMIKAHRDQNPGLKYVVVVGGDEVIPFARIPDDALVANEENYYPPVLDNTASQASLRLGYVLTQDVYGSEVDLSFNNSTFPVPDLAVGRMLETAAEIEAVITAFKSTADLDGDGFADGVVTPDSTLATGYDFLFDAAMAIQTELKAGIGGDDTTSPVLIVERGGPTDDQAWTADDLRAGLLPEAGAAPGLVFLAGHFTGNSALAADYTTRLLASEVAESSVDMTNSIIFSIGCHAGYNIVNQHGITNVTRNPDWAQAFASKGATLVAGTAYQYGDTDLLKYSEALYLEFIRQLRLANAGGPVSVGEALVEAKKAYLVDTLAIGGLDEKAVVEATVFGLPMLKVDLNRNYVPSQPPTLSGLAPTTFTTNPGLELGLAYDDVTVSSPDPLIVTEVDLMDVETGLQLSEPGSYLTGSNGWEANPGEPILPLEVRDATVGGTVLRGVGFRGGIYEEVDILPLISSATTENSGVHTPFLTDHSYPIQPWRVNYFDALDNGSTLLMVTPAQHRTSTIFGDPQKSTRRQFSEMDFRLYYSNNTQTFTGDPDHPSTPATSAPPSIISVSDVLSGTEVTLNATVVGNPSAGIQEVWVTHTVCDPNDAARDGTWTSTDLVQSAADSTQWAATAALADLGVSDLGAENVCYIVQAVNGVGLVSRADNLGLFFRVDVDLEPTVGTVLQFQSPAPNSSGAYGTKMENVTARLTDENGSVLAGQVITFRLGSQMRRDETDGDGVAQVDLALLADPGLTEIKVAFPATGQYKASDATTPFTILEQATVLSLDPQPASGRPEETQLITATLKTVDDRPLFEKTVVFEVTGSGGSYTEPVITDFAGRAILGNLPLPRSEYTVNASFDQLFTDLKDDPRYQASDVSGSLTLLNTPPVAEVDNFSIDKYELKVTPPGMLGNDTDKDGDPLTAVAATQPASGTLTLNADGSFTYEPNGDFDSLDDTDSFTYSANDGFDNSDEVAAVTIVPSVCFVAEANVEPDNPPSIWPPNGDPITVTVRIDPTTSISITGVFQDEPVEGGPAAEIIGADTVQVLAKRAGNSNGRVYHILFTATDQLGATCQGDVRVPVVSHDQSGDISTFDEGPLYDSTVAPKSPPVAGDDASSATEDGVATGNVLDNDTDQNPQDILSVAAVNADSSAVGSQLTLASGAWLTVQSTGSYTYETNGQFESLASGQTVTDTFEYTVDDGGGGSDTGLVIIGITGLNDAPVAAGDGPFTTLQTSVMTGNVLDNDSDVEGDPLTALKLSDPLGGSLTLDPNGTFTYTPTVTGQYSFTYQASDGDLVSNVVTATIVVNAVDNPPAAVPDGPFATDEDTTLNAIDVLTNDTDDSSIDPATVTIALGPNNGTVSVDPDSGQVMYMPHQDFNGADSFTYTVDDDAGQTSNEATVSITVNPINDAPVANDDAEVTEKNTSVTIDVLANDEDVDLDLLTITNIDVSITQGSVDCTSGQCIYTPPVDFIGTDGFTYQVSDANGSTDTAAVTVTVNPVNDPPEAFDDYLPDPASSDIIPRGATVTIDVLANDMDTDEDTLTIIDFGQPARGSIIVKNVSGGQVLEYTPDSNFRGIDTFTYTISDGKGGTDTATVTLTFGRPRD